MSTGDDPARIAQRDRECGRVGQVRDARRAGADRFPLRRVAHHGDDVLPVGQERAAERGTRPARGADYMDRVSHPPA